MSGTPTPLAVEMARLVLAEIPQNIEADAKRFLDSARLCLARFPSATKADCDAMAELVEHHRGLLIADIFAVEFPKLFGDR